MGQFEWTLEKNRLLGGPGGNQAKPTVGDILYLSSEYHGLFSAMKGR